MPDVSILAVIVAVLGAGGIGATIREIVGVITKVLGGMSGKEDRRKLDIVAERNAAIVGQEREAKNRRILEEELAETRRLMITEYGVPKADLPPWPEYEHTITPAAMREARDAVDSALPPSIDP